MALELEEALPVQPHLVRARPEAGRATIAAAVGHGQVAEGAEALIAEAWLEGREGAALRVR